MALSHIFQSAQYPSGAIASSSARQKKYTKTNTWSSVSAALGNLFIYSKRRAFIAAVIVKVRLTLIELIKVK